ncbi:MAG TPA: hypothetical protein PKD99_03985 [Sphingopyxis sp.]|mgnify:CR=1 FL=1|nr:hypothetical protein [Sphingopyxis sp.]HMP44243.1 hypothetical protein [Sphingopyxis sp.]HMQ19182.1 hypothetical protein [Sphingopyxis sp.]
MSKDLLILVGSSPEQIRAMAEGKYDIICSRQFDTLDTDFVSGNWKVIASDKRGAVAIAKRL